MYMQIQHKYPCARIEGLDVIDGLFLIGLSHFYIIDGLMMLSTGEISDIQSLPEEYVCVEVGIWAAR